MSAINACGAASEEPHESKFKHYGKFLIKYLEAIKPEESPFHWYQIQAVLKTRELVRQDKKPPLTEKISQPVSKPILIVAPTGAGKSGIIVMLPYVLESSRVLVLTPSKVISDQLRVEFGPSSSREKCFLEKTGYETDQTRLENFLEPVKMIKTAEDVINKGSLGNLVIVNAQKFGGTASTSLVHNDKEIVADVQAFFAHFDTLIVDEAHHYPAKTWEKIVDEFSKRGNGNTKRIIFLTATPYRTNKAGEKQFIWELFEGGKERISMVINPQDVEGITTRVCKFMELDKEPTNDELAQDLTMILEQHYQTENRFVPQAMVLVRTQKDATETATQLNKILGNLNFAVAMLGSECGTRNRRLSGEKTPLEKFTAGEYRVAVTCGVALEGYDNSKVTLCVILRKIVTGRVLFTQFVGRCKRMQRKLDGGGVDGTVATVLSYCRFEQRKMWEDMDSLAESDPVEVDDVNQ